MSAAAQTISISPETQAFLDRNHQIYINGDWYQALGETISIM